MKPKIKKVLRTVFIACGVIGIFGFNIKDITTPEGKIALIVSIVAGVIAACGLLWLYVLKKKS